MTEEPKESVPLFDVVVRIPPGMQLEDIQRLARAESGLPEDRIDKLINALRSVPQAKIGNAVTRERADRAREQFSKTGLLVEVTPVLQVQALMTTAIDERVTCPACNTHVMLTEQRQCPKCGVFVDKVTDEFLLKKRILEQERARIASLTQRDAKKAQAAAEAEAEAALRADIRRQLEKELAKAKRRGLISGAVVTLLLVCAAFVAGRGSVAGWTLEALLHPETAGPKGDLMASLASTPGSAGKKGTAAAAGAASAPLTGDADLDDPLIQAAGGQRSGKGTLSVEQAVAASKTLAKSVGNNTADRGAAGAAAGAEPGSAAAAANTPAEDAVVALQPQAKTLLAIEFARQLGEMGQSRRALELIKLLKASAPVRIDPDLAGAAQAAEVQARAWMLLPQSADDAAAGAESLVKDVEAIPDVALRARTLASAAAILGRHPSVSADVPKKLLAQSVQVSKALADKGQRKAVDADLAVALGEVMVEAAQRRAQGGQLSQARAYNAPLEGLVAGADGAAAQARLEALNHRLKRQLGDADKAEASLNASVAHLAKDAGAAGKAALLRDVARLGNAATNEKVGAASAAIEKEASAQAGLEQARALAQLAILRADAGQGGSAELEQAVQKVAGVPPADAALVQAGLVVNRDMAAARRLHAEGRYAQAEAVVQRLGRLLF